MFLDRYDGQDIPIEQNFDLVSEAQLSDGLDQRRLSGDERVGCFEVEASNVEGAPPTGNLASAQGLQLLKRLRIFPIEVENKLSQLGIEIHSKGFR